MLRTFWRCVERSQSSANSDAPKHHDTLAPLRCTQYRTGAVAQNRYARSDAVKTPESGARAARAERVRQQYAADTFDVRASTKNPGTVIVRMCDDDDRRSEIELGTGDVEALQLLLAVEFRQAEALLKSRVANRLANPS
jgi:hypothetical protein